MAKTENIVLYDMAAVSMLCNEYWSDEAIVRPEGFGFRHGLLNTFVVCSNHE